MKNDTRQTLLECVRRHTSTGRWWIKLLSCAIVYVRSELEEVTSSKRELSKSARQQDFHSNSLLCFCFATLLFPVLHLDLVFMYTLHSPAFTVFSVLVFWAEHLIFLLRSRHVKDEADEGTRWDAGPSTLRARWSGVTAGLVMRGWIHAHTHRRTCMCTHRIIQYINMHSQLHPARSHSSSATLLSRYVTCLITGR